MKSAAEGDGMIEKAGGASVPSMYVGMCKVYFFIFFYMISAEVASYCIIASDLSSLFSLYFRNRERKLDH